MLTSAFKALVKNPIKESFYGKKKKTINVSTVLFRKRKKKTINVLTVFFISHKNDVKTFFNWILNQYPKGTR